MFSAIIVEDEHAILKYMKKIVEKSGAFRVRGCYESPEEALSSLDFESPDVAFLDIEMPRMNGIELAARMLEKNSGINVVFTTAYGKYALDAFGVEAIDYLLKPVLEEDILRVARRLKKSRDRSAGGRPPFTAYCFGRFEVFGKGGRQISWPTRKSEELFAYFASNQGRTVSKWKLLELLWPDLDNERGLHNLYNTVYRIKAEMKKLDINIGIRSINEGYILEDSKEFSDLRMFLNSMEAFEKQKTLETANELFMLYDAPLFGDRDYPWSMQMQQAAMEGFRKLGIFLIREHRKTDDFKAASDVARRYVSLHAEDEGMIKEWLSLLDSWEGRKDWAAKEKEWLRAKLAEAELPLI